MTADIRDRLLAVPFRPFTIRVADGHEYSVPTPDHAHVHPKGLMVSVYTDDHREFLLPARQLSGVAFKTSKTPGA